MNDYATLYLRSLKSWIDYIIDNQLTYGDYTHRFHTHYGAWKKWRMEVRGYGKGPRFDAEVAMQVWRDMIEHQEASE